MDFFHVPGDTISHKHSQTPFSSPCGTLHPLPFSRFPDPCFQLIFTFRHVLCRLSHFLLLPPPPFASCAVSLLVTPLAWGVCSCPGCAVTQLAPPYVGVNVIAIHWGPLDHPNVGRLVHSSRGPLDCPRAHPVSFCCSSRSSSISSLYSFCSFFEGSYLSPEPANIWKTIRS